MSEDEKIQLWAEMNIRSAEAMLLAVIACSPLDAWEQEDARSELKVCMNTLRRLHYLQPRRN